MKYISPLISVSNMQKSIEFYRVVLDQKVGMDMGSNVTLTSGLALQAQYAELAGLDPAAEVKCSHNFELYFEEDDIDAFAAKLESMPEVEIVHGVKEYPWGQRVIRIYDPDKHIIEIGENMDMVLARFFRQGMTAQEIQARTGYPMEYVLLMQKKLAGE